MRTSLLCVAAGLMLPLMTGCAASPGVVRGQSPEYGPASQGNIQQAVFGMNRNQAPYFEEGGIVYNSGGPAYAGDCNLDGCGHQFCAPRQSYRFRYVVPQGLTYPDQNAMPGVVQYPYYTLKGPDCFFHD